jgi:hypothetical protein
MVALAKMPLMCDVSEDILMKKSTDSPAVSDEQEIMIIVHRLPPERKSQILAFARFLAFETFQTTDLATLEEIDFEDTYTEADARWDQLLASEEGQLALDRLADAALASIRAGEASAIGFTKDGEIAPR